MQINEQSITIEKKKQLAKIMYLNGQYTQKAIAETVEVSEQSLCRWVKDEKWDALKTDTLTSNEKQLAFLYSILEKMNEEAVKALTDDDPATNPDTDGIIKITKAIHYLQTKTGIGQMYETGMAFLTFLQKENPALAKEVAPLFHVFIKQNL